MNNVSISGRLVYEPEIKYTANGTAYLSSRIAVDRHDKDKNTDFFTIRAWGKTAEFVTKYFHKGSPVEIIGKLQTNSYENQEGKKVTDTFILAIEVVFVLKSESQAPAEAPKSGSDVPFEI